MEGKRGEQSCSPLAGIWAEIPSGAVTAKQEQDRARGDDQAPGSVVAGGLSKLPSLASVGRAGRVWREVGPACTMNGSGNLAGPTFCLRDESCLV